MDKISGNSGTHSVGEPLVHPQSTVRYHRIEGRSRRQTRSAGLLSRSTASLLQLLIPYKTISEVSLINESFYSTVDVLRLLGTLPNLTRAYLEGCIFGTGSTAGPYVRSTRIADVFIRYDLPHNPAVSSVWSFALWWQWPHPSEEPHVEGFPGLHGQDARRVLDVLQAIPFDQRPARRSEPR